MTLRRLAFAACLVLTLSGCMKAEQPVAYYGHWVIGPNVVAHSSPLSDEEIDALIGQPVILSDNQATIGNKCCRASYRTEVISAEEFFWRCRIRPDEVGISTDHITEVDIEDVAVPALFAIIFVKDKDHLVLTFEGAYFQLRRGS